MQRMARSVPAMTKRPLLNSISDGGRFEHVAGDLLAFLDDLGGGFDDRGAAVHQRLRAAAAAADGEPIAVALHERDLLERDAELLAQHLRERRGVAHAEIERAGGQRHRAVAIESDVGQFLRRRRGDFQKVADTEPAQLAALAALALAPGKALAVGEVERLLGQRGEIAAVIGDCRTRSCTADPAAGSDCAGASARRSMPISAAAASISRSM